MAMKRCYQTADGCTLDLRFGTLEIPDLSEPQLVSLGSVLPILDDLPRFCKKHRK